MLAFRRKAAQKHQLSAVRTASVWIKRWMALGLMRALEGRQLLSRTQCKSRTKVAICARVAQIITARMAQCI